MIIKLYFIHVLCHEIAYLIEEHMVSIFRQTEAHPFTTGFLCDQIFSFSFPKKVHDNASKYWNLPRLKVLYLDDSGSMNGANLSEARGALRKMAHLLQDSPTRVCTWLGKRTIQKEL